jgi:1-deoxy-D-xylulose-5-phosphate reductoisomerase
MKRIAILGSTGTIGTQALRAAALHPDRFRVTALTAWHDKEKLFEQARAFHPEIAGLLTPLSHQDIPDDLRSVRWVFGQDVTSVIAAEASYDALLAAVVGIAGLKSVLTALERGKQVLLANKEALVAGGHIVMDTAKRAAGFLLPVDSEHSAIFQCLQGAQDNQPEKIILTASGGPFRAFTVEQMTAVTREQALNHPNWAMGPKITVDSATMFNKALEMIEAKWLFGLNAGQIDVVVHKESIVHSAVMFQDGSIIAQLGAPDMRVPILYAMAYPDRLYAGVPPIRLDTLGTLTFDACDPARFPALRLARECLEAGGSAACVMNAANEEAVAAFLSGRLAFTEIARVVENTLSSLGSLSVHTLEDILQADHTARVRARSFIPGG